MAVAPVVGIALVFHSTYYSYTAHTERSRQFKPVSRGWGYPSPLSVTDRETKADWGSRSSERQIWGPCSPHQPPIFSCSTLGGVRK